MSNKTIAKNTLFLYVRMFLTMAVSLFTSRIVLNALGVEGYGIYTVIGGVTALFSFLNSAMTSGTQRFLSIDIGKEDWKNLQNTFSTTFFIHCSIAIILILLGETIGLWFINNRLAIPENRVFDANVVYQFSLFAACISFTQVPYNGLLVAREKMGIFAAFSIIEVVLKLMVAYFLVVSPYNKLIVYSILVCVVSLIISFLYRAYCIRQFKESRLKLFFNLEKIKEIFSFSGWNLFGQIAGVARGQGINIVLNILFGTVVNASYGIMMQVQTAVMSFVTNFQTAVNPQIFKSYAKGDFIRLFKLTFESTKFSYFLMLILVGPIIYNIDYVLKIWLGTVPPQAANFVCLNLIFIMIDSMANPLMKIVLATGKIKRYQVYLGSFIFLSLPISYVLMKVYMRAEVFLYVIIAISIVSQIYRINYVRKIMNFPIKEYLKDVIMPIVIVTSLLCLVLLNVSIDVKDFFTFIMVSIFICVLTFFIIWFFGLTKGEKITLINLVGNKLARKKL